MRWAAGVKCGAARARLTWTCCSTATKEVQTNFCNSRTRDCTSAASSSRRSRSLRRSLFTRHFNAPSANCSRKRSTIQKSNTGKALRLRISDYGMRIEKQARSSDTVLQTKEKKKVNYELTRSSTKDSFFVLLRVI